MPDNNEASQPGHAQVELREKRLYGTGAWNTLQARDGISNSNPGPKNAGVMRLAPSSDSPPASDHGSVGTLWHSFELTHRRVQKGGWTHQVTERELPLSKAIAGVNMRLVGGAFREAHWHLADEWAYMLTGKARITLFAADGSVFVDDVQAGDLWNFPAGLPHSIQGLEEDGCEFLLVFNQGSFSKRAPSCSPTGSSTLLQISCVRTCTCIRKRSRSCRREIRCTSSTASDPQTRLSRTGLKSHCTRQ